MFIVLEGIGGSGKGTLMIRLCELMKAQGIAHVRTREPGGTPIAERLRGLVREGFPFDGEQHFANPWATTLLFNAARSQHVEELIIPSIRQDKVVLSDRFCDSTFVYQSVFMGLELDKLKTLHNLAIGIYPDMTFLLDCPAETANNRVTPQEKNDDQFDRASLDKQEGIRQAYLELAKEHPERYCVVDASGTPESVWEQVEPYFTANLLPLIKHEEYIYASQWAE